MKFEIALECGECGRELEVTATGNTDLNGIPVYAVGAHDCEPIDEVDLLSPVIVLAGKR